MKLIIANSFAEYHRYVRKNKLRSGLTRYISHELELHGIRGEVIIVNNAIERMGVYASNYLATYENRGIVTITRVSI